MKHYVHGADSSVMMCVASLSVVSWWTCDQIFVHPQWRRLLPSWSRFIPLGSQIQDFPLRSLPLVPRWSSPLWDTRSGAAFTFFSSTFRKTMCCREKSLNQSMWNKNEYLRVGKWLRKCWCSSSWPLDLRIIFTASGPSKVTNPELGTIRLGFGPQDHNTLKEKKKGVSVNFFKNENALEKKCPSSGGYLGGEKLACCPTLFWYLPDHPQDWN